MINPTLAYAHLNKGEPGMVQKTPLVSNLMDAGTASKVALNPQEQISSQQLLTKVGQDADTAVIGNIAAQAISTMIYAKYGANSATSSFANPGEAERRGISVMQQLGMKNAMA